jgi:hypothetical protein
MGQKTQIGGGGRPPSINLSEEARLCRYGAKRFLNEMIILAVLAVIEVNQITT